jgi:hypothetical protein
MSATILAFYQQTMLAHEAFNTFQTFLRHHEDNPQIIESLLVNDIRHMVRPLLHIFSTTSSLFYFILFLKI